jgi:putative phosphoesterase
LDVRAVAALYDVHGNLPALEAVLAELAELDVDIVVVGGDVVLGPMPREVLDLLFGVGRELRFVRGNADREAAEGSGEHGGSWVAKRLTAEQRDFLGRLPLTQDVDVRGLGRVVFCHATPRSDEEVVTRLTSEARMREILADVDADLVVCGHVHVRYDRVVAGKRIVNPGSVGLPYEGEPGAYWALLGPDAEMRRTAYEIPDAMERIRATAFPGADDMFTDSLVTPLSGDDVTAYFERVAAERA